MLSGVGDAEHLSTLGINTTMHLPGLVRIYMTTRHGALITEPAITGIP